ncbi:hypothetical protein TNIN_19711 [Trichonephila inaurata madagascariensis]|uniref:Uncharacterized protein n=1 Tax=Trichonephila inaurata madagascariensis TaxID=2747483 RepID=A0A8X7CJE6_9ARAC|nr:hypothetical protein TNIN_19711 [Trichonephila inaurata madagascariensis]
MLELNQTEKKIRGMEKLQDVCEKKNKVFRDKEDALHTYTFSNTSNVVALQTDSAELTPFFAIPRNQMVLESDELPVPRGLFSSEVVNEATTSRGISYKIVEIELNRVEIEDI